MYLCGRASKCDRNHRNGKSSQHVITDCGVLYIDVPREGRLPGTYGGPRR